MDDSMLEGAGGGGIVSLVIGVLTALGMKGRIDKLEEKVVYKDTCSACKTDSTNQFKAIHETLKDTKHRQESMDEKLDQILLRLAK